MTVQNVALASLITCIALSLQMKKKNNFDLVALSKVYVQCK